MTESELLKDFDKLETKKKFNSNKYARFMEYVNSFCSGEGMVGSNSYLMLWDKEEIEELNDSYEVNDFLEECILIGSDGGDTAYGINKDGYFFSVPFIGMANDSICYLGTNYIEFLDKLYHI